VIGNAALTKEMIRLLDEHPRAARDNRFSAIMCGEMAVMRLLHSGAKQKMTAGELINFLAQYDEDTPVYLSFDNGYTYGGITEGRFEEDYGEED